MRPLPLAALLLLASAWAHAQTRIGVVEAGSNSGSQAGSLTSTLPGGGAPQLVTLNLTAPSLGVTLGLQPVALAATPLIAAAPYAVVALAQSQTPSALPVSYISPARPTEMRPAPAPLDQEKTPISELIESTKRMFSESAKPGYQSTEYFNPGAQFQFGAEEVFRYRSALIVPQAKSASAEITALVSAAADLAKSAGIAAELGQRDGLDGIPQPVLKILPEKNGHRLNRLAWDLAQSFDSVVEYAPHRTNGGVAAYNSAEKVLLLPDFGREDAFEAILHESRHAAFAKRLRRGALSVFHASLLAYSGRSIAPNAETYDRYMSLEEISTHAKTLLHAIQRARRGGGAQAVSQAVSYAFQLMDVLRSAEINLYQLQRKLAKGEVKSYLVTGGSWTPIAGGHWEAINLPHAILVLPVLDEAPAPKRNLWNRLFKAEPETAAVKAGRRHVETLRPLVAALSEELGPFLKALRGDAPDLKKAQDLASRMVTLSAKADERFAATPLGGQDRHLRR